MGAQGRALNRPTRRCPAAGSVGWSPPRCRLLGTAMLDALDRVLPFLRDPSPPARL
jgi:hypothetical protein